MTFSNGKSNVTACSAKRLLLSIVPIFPARSVVPGVPLARFSGTPRAEPQALRAFGVIIRGAKPGAVRLWRSGA